MVKTKGIVGDHQAKRGIHGGIYKAVSLFSLEVIDTLAREGHPIAPGSTGENITISGDIWQDLLPGVAIQLGKEVQLKITSYATPCPSIKDSFNDADVMRLHHRNNPNYSRLYAQVLREGVINKFDSVDLINS